MAERLLIVGGDAAGMSAASQVRRQRGEDDVEIIALERGADTSFASCGIPYWISGTVPEREQLIARSPAQHRERGIDVRTGVEAVELDLDAAEVVARATDGSGEQRFGYDQLLLATGAEPKRPPLPGIDAHGVLGVQTLEDGARVLDALTDRSPQRAVVLGAGYIGLEMAEAMVRRGLSVTIVERADCPMATIDPDLGGRIAKALQGMGIELMLGVETHGLETDDEGWVRALETSHGHVEADLVVLGTGTRPRSRLGADAGVPVGDHGGYLVDRRQRTPLEGVWAAGDCAASHHRVSQRSVAIALGTIANKQGRVAGLNLAGQYATFPGVLGTAVTKVCELEIARTGLGEDEARAAGYEPVTATIESTTRAGYYPDAGRLTMKMIAEHGSGRLLGAQLLGDEGAAKRIDVVAMALWQGMDVAEMVNVDLSYAPPFSPVWDPVLIGARKAAQAVEEAR